MVQSARAEFDPDATERRAYTANAKDDVQRLRSYVYEVLTGPCDDFIRNEILNHLDKVEVSLRKALI